MHPVFTIMMFQPVFILDGSLISVPEEIQIFIVFGIESFRVCHLTVDLCLQIMVINGDVSFEVV